MFVDSWIALLVKINSGLPNQSGSYEELTGNAVAVREFKLNKFKV